MVSKVLQVLQTHFPGEKWVVSKPKDGKRKECYIANNSRKLFVKFDVPAEIIKRLGVIKVAPEVLASGEYGDISYIIQKFINGVYPDTIWIKNHIKKLAKIIKQYHEDKVLIKRLAKQQTTGYWQHIQQDLDWLLRRHRQLKVDFLQTEEMKIGFKRLGELAKKFEVVPLVPIHNEPNRKNMLVAGNELVFIDWDEITLSDPMRDIGLLLWWNFPVEQWKAFFQKYGEEMTADKIAKIYWFAARASFDVALWHGENGSDGGSFVEDFIAALDKRPNPKHF